MEHTDIKKYIEINGYRTMSELKTHFIKSDTDEEILMMNLTYLQERQGVKRIKFKVQGMVSSRSVSEDIYYIPAD
jgi:hypothetical protein